MHDTAFPSAYAIAGDPGYLASVVSKRIERCGGLLLRLGSGVAQVFTTATGRHVEPRNLNTAFHRLLARSGVRRIRFHDLRHTCATLLLSRGVSPRVVMDVPGHSQIAVTMNIYGHVIPAIQQSAADEINAALADEEAPPPPEEGQA